jgi:hypothetical protein
MYVSEDIKQQLKAQAGNCIQVDATQVEQPWNPGDGLIKKPKVLGPAPAMPPWESPAGMKIAVAPAFENGQAPAFNSRVENTSETPVTLRIDAFAPTLLAETGINKLGRSPAYGPAVAVVTRQSFWVGDCRPSCIGPGRSRSHSHSRRKSSFSQKRPLRFAFCSSCRPANMNSSQATAAVPTLGNAPHQT